MDILLISIAIVAIFGLALYIVIMPTKSTKFVMGPNSELDPKLNKLMKMFGGDVLALIDANKIEEHAKEQSLEKLFKESNNPWKLSIQEFVILRILLAGLGVLIGAFGFAVFKVLEMGVISYAFLIILPIVLYKMPVSVYSSAAKDRAIKFKAQLPEAIDLLIMILSGPGYSLSSAFDIVVDYLEDGVVKDEFIQINNDMRTGMTMEAAMTNFADRAPTDGIKAFSKAIINANRLSVSMSDIMKARSFASRKELEVEIEKRVTTLPQKVTLILSPTAVLSILLVAAAPTINSLIKML